MTTTAFHFDRSGGDPVVDFVNTLDERLSTQSVERLPDYETLIGFVAECGFVTPAEALALAAAHRASGDERVLARVVNLREAVFEFIAAMSSVSLIAPRQLALVNQEITGAQRMARLTPGDRMFSWRWMEPLALDRPLWELARAVEQFLCSARLARVRKCTAEDCGSYYVDDSRTGRRWCSMANCGNRHKVRRFRAARQKGTVPLSVTTARRYIRK